MTIKERIKNIKLLLLDVDGVLTDGRIIYDSKGCDSKFFDVHDGLGVYLLKKAGIPTILITAKASKTIIPRAKDMQVDKVISGLKPKCKVYAKLLKTYKIKESQVCFVGDDLVDLSAMKRAGLAVAVFNACADIKNVAHLVTKANGGRGAVREVAELILKTQNKWKKVLSCYE